jgi:hypothetical protein
LLGHRFSFGADGGGELLQEHVDLDVKPRTPRHGASLPSSATALGYIRPAGGDSRAEDRYRLRPFRCCFWPDYDISATPGLTRDQAVGRDPGFLREADVVENDIADHQGAGSAGNLDPKLVIARME